MDIGIINYNGGTSLIKCVQSLCAQTNPVRVFIFDNASTDNSIEILKSKKLDCKIITSNVNLGYAGACNKLLEIMDANTLALCNMDLEFDCNWSKNVEECFLRHSTAGSVASLVIENSGVINAVGVLLGRDLFAVNEYSGKNISEVEIFEKEVFGCYGAVMCFKKDAALAAGKMDESFFLFFEETEWYFRHNLAGFKTYFCPNAKVYHERSKTTVRYSPLKLFYSERNRVRSAIRLLPVTEILKLPIRAIMRYIYMAKGGVSIALGNGKKLSKVSIIKALFCAWLQALICLPNEIYTRNVYRKKFGNVTKKVQEILKKYAISKE